MSSTVWLVGVGVMGIEYAKVLRDCAGRNVVAIGRGDASAKVFAEKTGMHATAGGLEARLASAPELPDHAIVAVGVDGLYDATRRLLEAGVRNILVEKPGCLWRKEMDHLVTLSKKKNATVSIAYNRRYYAAVAKAESIIGEDGGVASFQFEFTEWSHQIKDLKKPRVVLERWFLSNSSHVADLAYYLGGFPVQDAYYAAGSLEWHPASSVFSGAGVTDRGALFSYSANWAAPGRWGVEIMTRRHRLIFRPMEMLQIQDIGSVEIKPVAIDDEADKKYKPGLFREVNDFLLGDRTTGCSLDDQRRMYDVYTRMAGYAD